MDGRGVDKKKKMIGSFKCEEVREEGKVRPDWAGRGVATPEASPRVCTVPCRCCMNSRRTLITGIDMLRKKCEYNVFYCFH